MGETGEQNELLTIGKLAFFREASGIGGALTAFEPAGQNVCPGIRVSEEKQREIRGVPERKS